MTHLNLDTATGANGPRDLWHVSDSGTWAQQNEAGRREAADVLAAMRATGHPLRLGRVVEAMIAKGRYGGVEVGFFNAIAVATICSAGDGAGLGLPIIGNMRGHNNVETTRSYAYLDSRPLNRAAEAISAALAATR